MNNSLSSAGYFHKLDFVVDCIVVVLVSVDLWLNKLSKKMHWMKNENGRNRAK